MLESSVTLDVTIASSKRLDDIFYRHSPENRMVGPEPASPLPSGERIWPTVGFSLCRKHNLVFISDPDVSSVCSLCCCGHDPPFCSVTISLSEIYQAPSALTKSA